MPAKYSDRGRPFCRDLACDVEVHALGRYCAAHEWRVQGWLKRSWALMERLTQHKEVSHA